MTVIPLSYTTDRAGYKLLELPPELVELIEGDGGPEVLQLTSSPTSALLKTPTKTYTLSQKNTSNALILLRTTTKPSQSTDSSNTSANTTTTTTGLQAFATLHETIELVALQEGQDVPVAKARGKWHEKFGRTR